MVNVTEYNHSLLEMHPQALKGLAAWPCMNLAQLFRRCSMHVFSPNGGRPKSMNMSLMSMLPKAVASLWNLQILHPLHFRRRKPPLKQHRQRNLGI